MNYREKGFRAVYKQFCVFQMDDSFKRAMFDFPGVEESDGVLVYGYIDTESGFTLDIFACAQKDEEGYRFIDIPNDVRSIVRIEQEMDCDFEVITDESLPGRYAERLKQLDNYAVEEDVERSRTMEFLDSSRHESFIDDVMVYLVKDGLRPEGCWVRIIGLLDSNIIGKLLNEPDQDFGYHNGETIGFFVQKTEDGGYICVSDMNPSEKLTEEDLKGGTRLKMAIQEFNQNRTEPNFISVLEYLRDSYVWIPCNAVLSDADQERLQKIMDEGGLQKGTEFSTLEDVRMVPDILKNGDAFFFPVFSSEEEMGEYGDRFSKIEKHMLEAVSLAQGNEKELTGIVVNPFTDPFVLESSIYDIFVNMKSRIR